MNLARRALLVSGLFAAVAAAPAAALAGNHTVQIGGRLVAPEQLSSFERSLSSPATGPAGSSGNDVTARNVGIASGALLVLALLLGASTLMRRRPRPIAA